MQSVAAVMLLIAIPHRNRPVLQLQFGDEIANRHRVALIVRRLWCSRSEFLESRIIPKRK